VNVKEKQLISDLVKKYNSILLHSTQIAITEDLINLIIANREDEGFELTAFIKNKEDFKKYVVGEFFKLNNTSILSELSSMEESFKPSKKQKDTLKLPF
jgi:hypothetical protein